jgi:4-carboxymuconolactone decarboxylase
MPRIPYPSGSTDRRSPGELNIARMTAHMPVKLRTAMGEFGRAVLTNDELDEHLRELIILRVGYLSGSAYELHQHVQLSRRLGVPEAKLDALEHDVDAACFDDRERAVLRFVDEVVRDVRPGDATLATVSEHLSYAQLFSVMATVGVYMLVCRILETTGVELDEAGVVIDPSR